jgi:ribosome recycling factor
MSPETKLAMAKLAHHHAEQTRVSIRHIRQKGMAEIKAKGNGLGEDTRKRHEKEMEQLTKRFVSSVDEALKRKEAELTS